MMRLRKCRRHGVCNNCGIQQSEADCIWEIRVSLTGQGWSTVMLCDKCIRMLHENIAEEILRQKQGGKHEGD